MTLKHNEREKKEDERRNARNACTRRGYKNELFEREREKKFYD